MSRKIEIDGRYYRLLQITGLINKSKLRKGAICTEDGHLVEDEQIVRKCLRMMLVIIHAEVNKSDIQLLLTQEKKNQHEPKITAFKQIKERLQSLLNKAENEAMDFHLYYLKEVYRI